MLCDRSGGRQGDLLRPDLVEPPAENRKLNENELLRRCGQTLPNEWVRWRDGRQVCGGRTSGLEAGQGGRRGGPTEAAGHWKAREKQPLFLELKKMPREGEEKRHRCKWAKAVFSPSL